MVRRLERAGCVFADEEGAILVDHAADRADLDALAARRVAGEPLEVIVGWVSFAGLRVQIDTGVFVPRRRTLLLVEQAIACAHPGNAVVDLCCGSGAIGLAVAHAVPGIDLHACDVDPVAVRCAARNLAGIGAATYCGDLFGPLPDRLRGHVDLVVVNAPYVPTDEIAFMPPEARDHEPRHTLDGGPDGVDIHRRVAAEVTDWLRPGGSLLIETSKPQAPLTSAALAEAGLTTSVATSDELSATVAIGRFGIERPTR
ncbi:putative protein N(5)-glutamine methyltransferase [Gordonia sp. CPCC 205515]|uniref:putative protein N(5)-glutamine methyltransferase n=1 Tax=Gordonia sp. CPCC 205515 TaxID=3140791 RepID=UPI003AF3EC6E